VLVEERSTGEDRLMESYILAPTTQCERSLTPGLNRRLGDRASVMQDVSPLRRTMERTNGRTDGRTLICISATPRGHGPPTVSSVTVCM